MGNRSQNRHIMIARLIVATVVACLVCVVSSTRLATAPSAEAAFRSFWEAETPAAAAKAGTDIIASGIGFEDALARLKAGRTYSGSVQRGIVRRNRWTPKGEFFYALNIPPTYDPARRYQVRFQLHGGVMGRSTSEPRGDGSIGALAGAPDQIYIIPYSWVDAPWWSDLQIENLRGILDSAKRTYNIDENRVAVAGVSDGATGTFYVAMRDTTPYASFESLNGFIMVLNSPQLKLFPYLFPHNLLNKPFFVVNGGRDPLYPTRGVEPFINHLKAGGVPLEYLPQPNGAHNTAWWPDVKGPFELFVHDHPRDPLPSKLTWTTTRSSVSNRAHWLVIDRLASTSPFAAPALPDLNKMAEPGTSSADGDRRVVDLFPHPQAFGRVDLVKTGNVVEATTRGVAELTLLLSPDAFDFSQAVRVVTNGKTAFEGRVDKSLETLIKWGALDNDRTMLFGAELHLKIDQQ